MIGFLNEYCCIVNDRTNTVNISNIGSRKIQNIEVVYPKPKLRSSAANRHKVRPPDLPRLYICLSGLNSLAVSIYQFYWPNNTQPRPHSSKLGAKLDSAAAEIANKIMVYVGPQGWTSILTRPLEPVRRKGRIPLLMQSYKNVKVLYYVVN